MSECIPIIMPDLDDCTCGYSREEILSLLGLREVDTIQTLPDGSTVHMRILQRAYKTATASGDPAVFASGGEELVSLKVNFAPVVDYNGYAEPWVGGAGKNKFESTGQTTTVKGVTFTRTDDGQYIMTGHSTGMIGASDMTFGTQLLPAGEYIVSGNLLPSSNWSLYIYDTDNAVTLGQCNRTNPQATITLTADTHVRLSPQINTGITFGGQPVKPMIRLSSEADASWTPYENIGTISGRTGLSVHVSHTVADGTVYAVTWEDEAGEVYGGELDITTGVLTAKYRHFRLTGNESWTGNTGSSRYYYVQRSRSMHGAISNTVSEQGKLCSHYPNTSASGTEQGFIVVNQTQTTTRVGIRPDLDLYPDVASFKAYVAQQYANGTPIQQAYILDEDLWTTYQLTPQQVASLVGRNNVWSDAGDVEVTYYA